MKKIIVSIFFMLAVILLAFIDESEYSIENKRFVVHETKSGINKIITSNSEKILFDTGRLGSVGQLDKFQVNDKSILFTKDDHIYLYTLADQSLIKIHENYGHNFAYSKKYKKIIFEKKEVLYIANMDGSNIQKIGNIAVSPFFYNYIVFINEHTFLYQTYSTSNKRVVTKYNLKDKTKQVGYEIFSDENCFPVIHLHNENFICRDDSKEHKGLYTIDTQEGSVEKTSIKPSGKYLYHIKDLNAVFYLKVGFSLLDGVIFETRIYFLETKKDFLWSKKYLQPIELL